MPPQSSNKSSEDVVVTYNRDTHAPYVDTRHLLQEGLLQAGDVLVVYSGGPAREAVIRSDSRLVWVGPGGREVVSSKDKSEVGGGCCGVAHTSVWL